MNESLDTGLPYSWLRERVFAAMPAGWLGQFDLVSGTMTLNFTSRDYERARSRPNKMLNRKQRQFYETGMHEYFHYLQFLGSGFLYRVACELHDRILEVVNDLSEVDDEAIKQFGNLTDKTFETIRRPDEEIGVSVLDLIEGAAYLFGSFSASRITSPAKYLREMQRQEVNPVYRNAYQYAHEHLDDDAMKCLIYLSGIALQHSDPIPIFRTLVEGLGIVGLEEASRFFPEVLSNFADSSLGNAYDVWEKSGGTDFAWYKDALIALRDNPGLLPVVFELDPIVPKIVGAPTMISKDTITPDTDQTPIQLLFAALTAELSARPSIAFDAPD